MDCVRCGQTFETNKVKSQLHLIAIDDCYEKPEVVISKSLMYHKYYLCLPLCDGCREDLERFYFQYQTES